MKIRFEHVGPERETSIELPPKAPWIGDYVLAFDERLERIVYFVSPDFHELGHAYAFDGERFETVGQSDIRTESPEQRWQGFYDPSRESVVGWNFCWESDRPEPFGVMMRDGESKKIETRGDAPSRSEDADETGAVFAYDRKRDVTVCLTQLGVWELDAEGNWSAKRDGEGIPTEDWKNECHGGAWDPVRERCFFWAVAEDDEGDDRFWLWTWDGESLYLQSNDGLPEKLITGWMNVGPLLCGHPRAGLVAYCGHDGFIVFDGTKWASWIEKDEPFAPKSTQAKIAYDPRRDMFVLGPGDYEPAPGDFPEEQHLFWVRRDDAWTKLGVTVAKSAVSELWAKRFGGFSAGRWRMMGNFYLTLLEWTDAGWNELLDKRAQQGLWDGGNTDDGAICLVGLVDCDGVTHAVSNEGHVFRWIAESKKWELVHGEHNALKRRMWASLCWDPKAKRIVVWGGRVKGRKNNDLLFFEDGAWRVSRKKSARPSGYARKKNETEIEHQLYWDAKLEAVVRVGWDELAVLQDETWVVHTPKDMGTHNAERWRGVAHDPKSGVTLLLDFQKRTIATVTPDACVQVASYELPELVLPNHVDEPYAYRCLTDDWAFDAETGLFHAQNPDDRWGHYVLDLRALLQA